jgi:hypothetical protein
MRHLQQVMCQRFALSTPHFGPSASNDAGSGATWMRPNRRCQIGATQISFNGRVRPLSGRLAKGVPKLEAAAPQ